MSKYHLHKVELKGDNAGDWYLVLNDKGNIVLGGFAFARRRQGIKELYEQVMSCKKLSIYEDSIFDWPPMKRDAISDYPVSDEYSFEDREKMFDCVVEYLI